MTSSLGQARITPVTSYSVYLVSEPSLMPLTISHGPINASNNRYGASIIISRFLHSWSVVRLMLQSAPCLCPSRPPRTGWPLAPGRSTPHRRTNPARTAADRHGLCPACRPAHPRCDRLVGRGDGPARPGRRRSGCRARLLPLSRSRTS